MQEDARDLGREAVVEEHNCKAGIGQSEKDQGQGEERALTELHAGQNYEDQDFLVLEGAPVAAESPELERQHEHEHGEVHARDHQEKHDPTDKHSLPRSAN